MSQNHALSTGIHSASRTRITCTLGSIHASGSSLTHSSHDSPENNLARRPQPDLLYLNILQDTVENTVTDQSDVDEPRPNGEPDDSFNDQIRRWNPPLQLDDIDNEYLTKKGVFQLPPPQYMYVSSSMVVYAT